MVRMAGLEPVHLSIPDPKSGASTNSATCAWGGVGALCHETGQYSSGKGDLYGFLLTSDGQGGEGEA